MGKVPYFTDNSLIRHREPPVDPSLRPERIKPAASHSPVPGAPGLSEAMFSALSISEKAPEIASCQTELVGFQAEPERLFDSDRVGRLGRLASPAVGRGFGFACRDVAVVCPGRLRAPAPPSLRTCGGSSRSVVHVHALRPAAFAERSSSLMSVGLAASASMCMCGADVGLACQRLARAMQCLRSMCENAYCMCA